MHSLAPIAVIAVLLLASGACKKDDKSKTTPGESSGTVTSEDTDLMGDGGKLPDSPPPGKGDGKAGDTGDDKAGDGQASGDGKAKPDQPEPPKIEPPDLDVGAAAQAQTVARHLTTARNALTGPNKDPDLALREARAALAADAANIDAVVLMAHAYHGKRLHDTAEVMLDMLFKSRKKAKNHPGVYYVYGLVYDHTNRPEQAHAAYQKAVELSPDYRSALVNLGVHHLRNRTFTDAIATYERLTGSLGVQNAVTWTNLGSAYRGHSGDYPPDSAQRTEFLRKAETAYKRALTQDKNYANVYYNLGLLYYDAEPFPMPDGTAMDKLKRLERAKTYFDEYRSLSGADLDLVASRTKQVNKLIKREKKRRKRADKKKGGDDDW